MVLPIIMRAEAKALGLKRYFTGKPCKNGHTVERTVNRANCLQCVAVYLDAHREQRRATKRRSDAKHRPEICAAERRRYAKNPEKKRSAAQIQRVKNPEKVRSAYQRWRAQNLDYVRAAALQWQRDNPERARERNARRRAAASKPSWADQKAIKQFYLNCPVGMVVDHIVPLKGRTVEGYPVSGLHLFNNLQYLTPYENCRKGNRMRSEDQALCESLEMGQAASTRNSSLAVETV